MRFSVVNIQCCFNDCHAVGGPICDVADSATRVWAKHGSRSRPIAGPHCSAVPGVYTKSVGTPGTVRDPATVASIGTRIDSWAVVGGTDQCVDDRSAQVEICVRCRGSSSWQRCSIQISDSAGPTEIELIVERCLIHVGQQHRPAGGVQNDSIRWRRWRRWRISSI